MKNSMHDISTTVFIIDKYNKYQNNENCRLVFNLNNNEYCIREVQLDWGKPTFPEQDWDDSFSTYRLYSTFEEARNFVSKLKRLNR